MNHQFWTEIDEHYQKNVINLDPRFEKIIQSCDTAGMPAINISANLGSLLEILVRTLRARRVLEIGTLGGFSTAWIARGLPEDGRIISLELDPDHAEIARRNLKPFEFSQKIEIRIGDALQVMSEMVLSNPGPFDLIFIDGDKSQYPDYLDLSIPLSRPGTLIIADNVIKHGQIFNEQIETPSQIGIKKFHEKIASDPRLEGSVIQTVGQKGHDGLAFIYVKDLVPAPYKRYR